MMDEQNESLEQAAKEQPKLPDKQKGVKELYSLIHDLVYVLAFIAVMFVFGLRLVTVDGGSMKSTLFGGDYEQGDIVVAVPPSFRDGKSPIVKRVIATEGQTVDIDFTAGIVYVDGVALDEPYTNTPTNRYEGVEFPVTVPEGCVFLMGDNRNDSMDSRDPEIGMVDTRYILGKVVGLVLPGVVDGERDFGRIGLID